MKRYKTSGQGSFVRYGLKSHRVRTNSTYRGGIRL